MQMPDQHIAALKHIGDLASASALIISWLGIVSGILVPLGSIAGAVWFIFRAIDGYWTFRDRLATRRAARALKANEVPGHPSV